MSQHQHKDLSSIVQGNALSDNDVSQPVSEVHLVKISQSHCRKWRRLPPALEMKDPLVWEDIEREVKQEEERRLLFFKRWQSEKGSSATYKKFVNALLQIDSRQDAEYVCGLLKPSLISKEHEGLDDTTQRGELVKENQGRIMGCFASLVNKFASKLLDMNIDMSKFRLFVKNLFPPGDFISKTATIAEIFDALTHNQLWSYSSCNPLESMFTEFGEKDQYLKDLLCNYKAQLAGFKATTKIIDFIKECSEDDELADSEQSLCEDKVKFNKKYCRKLTIKLQSRITEKSLDYIDDFWRSVADNFILPSLPTQLDSIREGCTEISWLISAQAGSQLEAALLSTEFLRQFEVIQVSLDKRILYATEVDQISLQEKLKDAELKIECLTKELAEKERCFQELTIKLQSQNLTNETPKAQARDQLIQKELANVYSILDNLVIQLDNQLIQSTSKSVNEVAKVLKQDSNLQAVVQSHESTIASMKNQVKVKDNLILELQTQLQEAEEEILAYRSKNQDGPEEEESLMENPPFTLTWNKKPDMPFEISDSIQSVFAHGKVYIGGGDTGGDCSTIMVFDTFTQQWGTLPPYKAMWFTMVGIDDQLVLVGGYDSEYGQLQRTLSMWSEFGWKYLDPEMPTARCSCSVVKDKHWLAVAGGRTEFYNRVLYVEVLNTSSKQWHSTISTPAPWTDMKTAIVGDTCYFLGGSYGDENETPVIQNYSIPLKALFHPQTSLTDMWTEIPVEKNFSSPLSICGHLLAFGGLDNKTNDGVSFVYIYQPDSDPPKWEKLLEMPSSRYFCACTKISDRQIFIAGGSYYGDRTKDDCYAAEIVENF